MYKVLIVEDEEPVRKMLTFLMSWEKVGCVVVGEAADGEEGISMIRRLRPDIVICDIRMPVMDGLEMLEASMDMYGYQTILLTGYGEFEFAQKAISLGVQEYLLKPVDFNKLTVCMQKIVCRFDKQKQLQEQFDTATQGVARESLLRSEWLMPGAAQNHLVNTMMDYVRANYFRKLSVKQIAKEIGITPSYLISKFKAATGYTFNDFLNRYRIMQALELMQQPDNRLRIYEIAEEVGFSDYKYFIKVFKKHVGYPPNRFLSGQLQKSSNVPRDG
jgi:two-component system response regulator YesN